MLMVVDEGTLAGAVYNPVGDIVPTEAFPPATPPADHCTEESNVPLPCTVVENCWVAAVDKETDFGLMDTPVM